MPYEPEIAVSNAAERDGESLLLFLVTGVILTAAQLVIGGSNTLLPAAVKLHAVVFVLVGAGGMVWRWSRSLEWSVAFAAVLLALAARLPNRWMLLVPLALMSVMFVRTIDARWLFRTLVSVRMLVAGAVGATLVLTVMHYEDFLLADKLPYADVHQDTLFHAAIASMIKTYGIVSTGLNGLVPLAYHAFSHRISAGLSVLSGASVLEVYGVVATVFLGPFLLFAVTWASACLAPTVQRATVAKAWMTLCATLVLLKVFKAERLVLWDSYLLGDSYTLALALLVLAIPALASRETRFLALLGAAVLVLLSGVTKGSLGAIGLALIWARVVLIPGAVDRRLGVGIALAASLIFTFLMGTAAQGSLRTPFDPFFYAQLHSQFYAADLRQAVAAMLEGRMPAGGVVVRALTAVVAYLAVNLLFSWIVILRRLILSGWTALLVHTDSLLSLVAGGFAVATMMFKLIGAWSFINTPMFVALPFFIAACGGWLRRVPTWLLASVAAAGAGWAISEGYREVIILKTPARMALHRSYGPPPGVDFTPALAALRTVQSKPIFVMTSASPQPPPSFLYCAAIPFLYPAVSEHAWTGILAPESACPYQYYGYADYIIGNPRALVPAVIPEGSPVIPFDLKGPANSGKQP